ncbi:hypothetical protein B566_EDAN001814 [Ephemera danica]|nr:hypothetical protein B566_EDAN001814 [Ephemera danica]
MMPPQHQQLRLAVDQLDKWVVLKAILEYICCRRHAHILESLIHFDWFIQLHWLLGRGSWWTGWKWRVEDRTGETDTIDRTTGPSPTHPPPPYIYQRQSCWKPVVAVAGLLLKRV